MKSNYIGIALAWASVTLLLTACGGGSGGGVTSQTSTQIITGTAASGAALAGATVTIKDSSLGSAKTVTGIANINGLFSIPVTGMTPPFMLLAASAISGQSNLYSVLPVMDMAATNSQNVNVTPVTTLVMYELNGGADPGSMYVNGSFSSVTAALVSAKETIVRNKLPVNTVSSSFDMMYSQFSATGVSDSTGYDSALDGIGKISGIASTGVTFASAFVYTPAASNTTGTAEGAYTGSTTNGSSFDFDSVVLEDGSYYILYGIRSNGVMTVLGFTQGNGTSSNGGFSSANMNDFTASGTVLNGTLSATYSANSLGGSATEGGVTSTFLGTTPLNSVYVYNTLAKLTDITGAWALIDMQGGASISVNIAADGSFITSSGGCTSTGTLTPRPSGKNIFNFTTTFGAFPCKLPGQTATGIAIDFLLADGSRQFIAAGSNTVRTAGTAIFGTRAASTFNYSIGGTVFGLSGSVVLQDNNGDNLTITSNGSFTFATKVTNGNQYNVSVLSQPTGQTCSVSAGAGTVSGSNISNVTVVCSTNSYTVGGSVSGLSGTVVLQNNSGDNLTVSANGSFTFATQIASGSPYSVTVLTQPTGQTCSASTSAGTVSGSNISNVTVVCSNNYTVGGTVSGLTSTLVLQNKSNWTNLAVSINGNFAFVTLSVSGSPYSVNVLDQPVGQTCSVSNGTGIVGSANVTSVTITCTTNNTPGYIYTVAGGNSDLNSLVDGDNGPATSAKLRNPHGVAVDAAGNLYIAQLENGRIRKVDINGTITTLVVANQPTGIRLDSTTGNLYFSDSGNYVIRKVTTDGGSTTVAGSGICGYSGDSGPATSAKLCAAQGVAVDATGNLYIADSGNYRIRKVAANGIITTVAGNGVAGYSGDNGLATSAQINFPYDIEVDGAGNLYIADHNNNRIRKVAANGIITTVAGNGVAGYTGDNGLATSAQIDTPSSVAVDGAGNLYVAEGLNIRKVAANGIITTVAGNGIAGYFGDNGPATSASLNVPYGVAFDAAGNIYISDTGNNRVRKVVK